ncbi:MAG: hypothetical protein ABI262_05810 [Microcoleus sp.]
MTDRLKKIIEILTKRSDLFSDFQTPQMSQANRRRVCYKAAFTTQTSVSDSRLLNAWPPAAKFLGTNRVDRFNC